MSAPPGLEVERSPFCFPIWKMQAKQLVQVALGEQIRRGTIMKDLSEMV